MPHNNGCYEFGPFRLDTIRRVLTRGGETISLAPKATEILTGPKYIETVVRRGYGFIATVRAVDDNQATESEDDDPAAEHRLPFPDQKYRSATGGQGFGGEGGFSEGDQQPGGGCCDCGRVGGSFEWEAVVGREF